MVEGGRGGERGRWVAYNAVQKFASPRAVQSAPKAFAPFTDFISVSRPNNAPGILITCKKKKKNKKQKERETGGKERTLSRLIYLTAISHALLSAECVCMPGFLGQVEERVGKVLTKL